MRSRSLGMQAVHLEAVYVAERIRKLLTVTNLATVLESFDSEQEAVNSFGSGRYRFQAFAAIRTTA